MPYCTVADMARKVPESVLINLSNDATGASAVNAANVEEAIDSADNEINSYVGLVQTVPVSPVPPLLCDLSSTMAIWHLHRRKYFDSKVWKDAYENCQKILLRIAEGKLVLTDATAEDNAAVLSVGATRPQRFTELVWETFR